MAKESRPQTDLGFALFNRRMELDVTQKQVAHAAGMLQPAYSRLEMGPYLDIRRSTSDRLSYALGVSVDELIRRETSYIVPVEEIDEGNFEELQPAAIITAETPGYVSDIMRELTALRAEVARLRKEVSSSSGFFLKTWEQN